MQTTHESILRLPQVEALTGLRRERIRQLEVIGKFPARIKITSTTQQGAIGWPASEIDQWVRDRIKSARAAPRTRIVADGTGTRIGHPKRAA